MRIGTRVENEEGRQGRVAGAATLDSEYFYILPVKFDDGGEEKVREEELTPISTLHVKALKFSIEAHSAGWSALARTAVGDDSVSIVTARNDISKNEIALRFVNGRYDYEHSYAIKGGRRVKVRNVSEAKRLLGTI